MNDMQIEWIRAQNVTNDKFYVVVHKLKELWRIQDQLSSIQGQNAQQMTAQLKVSQNGIKLMENCDQDLFIREELNHNVAVWKYILFCLYSALKIFRSFLDTFGTNI